VLLYITGGSGEQLAKWIVNGKPDLDMYGWDIRRFPSKLTPNKTWLKERSHESYAKNYSIVFSHDEPLAGRNMRRDPLHQVRFCYFRCMSRGNNVTASCVLNAAVARCVMLLFRFCRRLAVCSKSVMVGRGLAGFQLKDLPQ
jgi:hypothetical protein